MKFNEILKIQRKSANMTQVQLAEKINVAQGTIANWERGVREPDIEMVRKIANALSVPVERFFSDIHNSPTDLSSVKAINFELASAPISMKRVPVIGEVAAGYSCLADMEIIDYVACDASLLHSGYDYVYLKVRGDSMEPELHEGDLVLVRVQDTVENGEFAVVLVDGDNGLVKKIEIDRTHITLISINPYYPPRAFKREEMNRVRIFGKVISSLRRF